MPTRPDLAADEILVRDREFLPHLAALGLKSVEEYRHWCARNGFSQRLDKHWRDRCRERYFATEQAIQQRLAWAREQKRKPQQILDQIFAGEVREEQLVQPHWLLIHQMAAHIMDASVRRAFHGLLLHAQKGTALLTTRPAVARLGGEWDNSFVGGARGRFERLLQRRGPASGNTFIDGLHALAHHHQHWLRSLEIWRPQSHSPSRQFASLANHLLAQYPVPAFMNSVWFRGHSAEAARQQGWYMALARGESPRNLDLPIALRGQMARHFLSAPANFFCEEAVRFGQVMGMGGDVRLVHAILGSRLGTSFEYNDYWVTVIHWLIRNPMLDPARIAPLIDFIHHQQFESADPAAADTAANRAAAPGFSVKGRTSESLLRQMADWHVRLRKEPPKKPQLEWTRCGIAPFECSEGTMASGTLRRWTIVEILSRRDLYEEGRAMKHCVASYDNSCAFGRSSIWSLGVERNGCERKRALTVEVSTTRRTVCQVRGKANRLASLKEIGILRLWAAQEQLALAAHIVG